MSDALALIATWVAQPGQEDAVAAAIAAMVAPSRAEPGCRLYQPTRDRDDPRVFRIVEIYDDEDAYAAHQASAHFQTHAVGDGIPRLERRDRVFAEVLGPLSAG